MGHSWDHPRVCGENSAGCNTECYAQGSPPRMRGKPSRQDGRDGAGRITPAYAGKTQSARAKRLSARDHPRVCGENNFAFRNKFGIAGSPPRMRGKLGIRLIHTCTGRITPAYAGKTFSWVRLDTLISDHPRVCGENLSGDTESNTSMGSPPRMRGKRSVFAYQADSAGITPAYAGKTFTADTIVGCN